MNLPAARFGTAAYCYQEVPPMKTGQTVVLMDSNDRGVIRSIGKHSIKIELEDGLIIEAVPGEFAVTCQEEERQMQASGTSRAKKDEPAPKGRKGSYKNMMTVDLHIESLAGGRNLPSGRRLDYQLEIFRRVLKDNLRHKGMKIIFIHGVGDGILKNAIRKELDERFAISCSYEIGNPAVTSVTVK